MKIFIETYGCESNQYATEVLAALLTKAGHKLVPKDESELTILNTCALESKTEKKIITRLKELDDSKQKILVAGCLTEVQKDKIQEAAPRASIMGTNSVTKINEIIEKIQNNFKVTRIRDNPNLLINQPRLRIYPTIATIQIAEGCLDACSYCVDRTTKGSLISYEPEQIIREVQNALKDGCVEMQLTSQDIASYGHDKGVKLPALIRKISSIPGNFRIRLGQMNPANVIPILDDLILSYNHPKVYQYLDIPVQSGSNRILKEMQRKYTKEEYQMIVSAFRKKYPEITISTDVMIGYPGETDDDFGKTIELIKETKPDIINTYTYSARPFTKPGQSQIPPWKIKTWAIELDQVYDKIKESRKESWLHWQGEVVVTQKVMGMYLARNYTYKPIILKKATLGETRIAEIIEEKPSYWLGRSNEATTKTTMS
ncbi:MAG: tRNA (N(6)-L-threonylcarbamoyladenosine(37)-C(2))-methylthiotransferase [archaeon]